jgi:hypothetical protein
MVKEEQVCQVVFCGHVEASHGHTYKLRPGRTYCLECYWNGDRAFEADIHPFRAPQSVPVDEGVEA